MRESDAIWVRVSEGSVDGELGYYLLTDVILLEGQCHAVYGVAVAFKSGDTVVMEKIHNVTCDKGEMLALVEKMMEGMVFPITLRDIIEDFIA